jgi:hypothetical protein
MGRTALFNNIEARTVSTIKLNDTEETIRRNVLAAALNFELSKLQDYTIGTTAGTLNPNAGTGIVQDSTEIDLRIQLLLNAIPIAHEGHIITSEYHNSLRDALLAIAKRLGLTIKPVSDTQLLTFAPNFLPEPDETITRWFIFFDKAIIHPRVNEMQSAVVRGAMTVQLPDDAVIEKLTVRGMHLISREKLPPKSFSIRLFRRKFDADRTKVELLIAHNLEKETGTFTKENDIKTTLDDSFDAATLEKRILDLSRVNNQKYQYFVMAEWEGGKETMKFEINSLQILCQV